MLKKSWLVVAILLAALVLAACSSAEEAVEEVQETAEEVVEEAAETTEEVVEEAEEAMEEAAETAEEVVEEAMEETEEAMDEAMAEGEEAMDDAMMGEGCPAVTIADRHGVDAGQYARIYELADFEAAAGCEMSFKENPSIVELNAQIVNNPELPWVGERLPKEPLVVVPYETIGNYGGTLNALSNATEAGTSDFLSVRHVNLVRYGEDYVTIEPNVAKGWTWNDDFTELTVELREGHKWSDGAPFTSADVEFWLNDLILNSDVYGDTPGFVTFGDSTMTIEVMDETTFKFVFPVPTPGILSFFATTYIQPWQPKHFFEAKAAEGFSIAEVAELWYGNSDWTDTPSPLLSGESDDVIPTLESHILVEETTEGRRLVANPYFFMVDTVGNQLPYIDEQDEDYVPEAEVRNLKITNGEVDYKVQSIFITDFPVYKENEGNGNYTVGLGNGVGETVFYGFNLTHPDEGLREIFTDVRFRQAMSLAMNREEIVELVYLGQAEPIQATPADPNTVNFVTEEHKTAFIEYDVDGANALLDEMGLVDADGDGFRDRLDGSNFTLDLQFSNQGGPVSLHELTKEYWEAVGVRTALKEVTSDEYREQGAANELEVLTWKYDGTAGSTIVLNTEMLLPPFGEFFNPGVAPLWAEWVNSDGASGVEPPADVIELYDIVAEFLQHPLGSPESDELGTQFVDIHVNNLWKIGIAGNVKAPIIRHNTLANFGPYDVVSYDYYRSYPMIPAQWSFTDESGEGTVVIEGSTMMDDGAMEEEAMADDAMMGEGCPAVTIADRMGVDAGQYARIYELADFEAAAGCKMVFSENPAIAELNAQIVNNPELPSVEERVPAEPLVVVPYETIGNYGGTLNALSNATEAGTSDFLSVRHVNLVRYGEDYVTIEPNVAKGWTWNDDFTELTVELREGHKWSDGAPFTSADVEFWLNELILNTDIYGDTPGFVSFGDETMTIEVVDETTFKFVFPVPTPGILSFFATTYIQPWQPKHFFEAKAAEGFSIAEVADIWYGNSDWTDTPSPPVGW